MLHFIKTFHDNTIYPGVAKDRLKRSIALVIGFPIVFYFLGNIWVGVVISFMITVLYFFSTNANHTFITFIEINDPDITVKYTDKTGEHTIYGSKHNVRFKREIWRYGSFLKVIVDERVVLKQYEIGDWTEGDMMALMIAQHPELAMKRN